MHKLLLSRPLQVHIIENTYCLPRHLGQHCPGRGGSGFGQVGRAHLTSLQSMVGWTVGSGGFVGGGLVTVCMVICKCVQGNNYIHWLYGHSIIRKHLMYSLYTLI